MSKKNTLKKTAALLLGLGLTVSGAGCSFVVTDNDLDLKQIVATVDITSEVGKEGNEFYAKTSELEKLITDGGLATDIPKRDLVAYFISVGLEYVNNYGYSYEEIFNLLMQDLVNQKILTQYAVAYYLQNGFTNENGANTPATADACIAYVNAGIEAATGKQKTLLESHRDVLAMEYFLTEGGQNKDEYYETVYYLKQSINSSLDSTESSYITAETSDHTHDTTRTTPTNANTLEDEYVPMKDGALDYEVYTGRNAATACGTYEKVAGSTATTRKKAYNMFLTNLQGYGLIGDEEDSASFTELNYYYVELATALSKAVANKYLTSLQDEAIKSLEANDYEYVSGKYAEILAAQQNAYTQTPADFETSIGSISDNSFVLYGYEDFGFVYNILLPFDAAQEQEYAAWKSKGLTQDELFNKRKDILAGVQAIDLRSAWFCEEDANHYAYEVSKGNDKYYGTSDSAYLFFEDNMKNEGQYKSLGQYLGQYPYNGKAEKVDGEWTFTPNKLTIGTTAKAGFIQEMESYINYAVGSDVTDGTWLSAYNSTTYTTDNVVDYSKFLYYEGKVTLSNTNRADYFYAGTETAANDSYQAVSAVNELMFAYSTDTGCLNTYQGYVVSPYKTNFVPEFEYAAQYAVSKGTGTYVVAPSDYGWHIIYVAFAYNNADGSAFTGEVYGGFNVNEIEKEGTFSNLFYNAIKDTSVTNYTGEVQNIVLNAYKNAATLHTKAYQDLLDLDA